MDEPPSRRAPAPAAPGEHVRRHARGVGVSDHFEFGLQQLGGADLADIAGEGKPLRIEERLAVLAVVDFVEGSRGLPDYLVPDGINAPHDAVGIFYGIDVVLIVGRGDIVDDSPLRPDVDQLALPVGTTCLGFHPVRFTCRFAPDDDDRFRLMERVADLNFIVTPAFQLMVPPH